MLQQLIDAITMTIYLCIYKCLQSKLDIQNILLKMSKHILTLFLALLLLTVNCVEDKGAQDNDDDDDDDDITTLTFLIQYEPEPDNDHIQIGLTVEAKDHSLKSAIQKVTDVVDQIKNLAENFCVENPEEGQTVNCQDVVDVEDFEISAEYVKRRKEEQVFQDFVVSHDVTVRVDNTDKIGELGDKLLKFSNMKIQSFDWESDQEEDDEQQAIEAGKEKAEDMCFHLGMKLHRIVSVEAVEDEDEEDNAGQEDGEEDDEQDQQGPLVYRFEVECIVDAQTEAKKNAEEEQEDKQKAEEQAREKQREEEEQNEKKKKKAPKAEKEQVQKKKKKK